MSENKGFLFDVKLNGAVRINAPNAEAAAQWLKDNVDCVRARLGIESTGREVDMEISLDDTTNAVTLAMDDAETRVNCLDEFTRHYLIAALFFERDEDYGEDDVQLSANYYLTDISESLIESAMADCRQFQRDHAKLLEAAYAFYNESGRANHPDAGSPEACAGHDFWLTRNHHGVGFWDRGMGRVGDALTQACNGYREIDLYAREGMVYAD